VAAEGKTSPCNFRRYQGRKFDEERLLSSQALAWVSTTTEED
jgi:hypothetical protein